MQKRSFVFHDAWGRRWWKFKFLSSVAAVVAVLAVVLFVISLLIPSQFGSPNTLESLKRKIRAFDRANQGVVADQADKILAMLRAKTVIADGANPVRPKRSTQIKAAFLPFEDKQAAESITEHGGELTHLCPEWLNFADPAAGLVEMGEPDWGKTAAAASLKVMPLLSNLEGYHRVPEAVEALARGGEDEKDAFIEELAAKLQDADAAGVVIDWEEVDQGEDRQLAKLVARIGDGLRQHGLETWLCVLPDATFTAWDFGELSKHVDRFVAMLHDEHGETDSPGPVASQDWFDGWLHVIAGSGDTGKWIASIACYGIDWDKDSGTSQELSFADAMSRARYAGCSVVRNGEPFFNSTFSYTHEGAAHEVWFLDAASFANQCNAVREWGLGGIFLNRPGVEDPAVWNVLAAESKATPEMLGRDIPSGWAIASVGRGEVVNLDPASAAGRRSFRTDAAGRILCDYERPSAHPTLFRMGGGAGNRVCLTFDDGPDPEYSPAILDILKERGVKAAFFVVGSEAEKYPGIIRRMVDEGHEIGNHSFSHPNLAKAPEALVKLELNATQRLVESLVGRSITLFRPPYNADSQPANLEELVPIGVAQSLGYMTVLESIDPRDWDNADKDQILQRAKDARAEGHIILLHDGGGDRSATVEALPAILDYLQERGDEVVTVGQLVGIAEDKLMPPLTGEKSSMSFVASGTGFGIIRILQWTSGAFLVVASILVFFRTVLVVALAILHKSQSFAPGPRDLSVSVVIPAFNEEKVIAKTLECMLASDYPGPMEILVVDDGSSDATAEVVGGVHDARLRLIRQPNGGKGVALQNGVRQATGEVIVFADADTQFDREAVSRMVDALRDLEVGAVSGQARVGNLRTFVARCQELEYVCNFNLDRRAYAAWNCITVVPGAISAVRRAAIDAAGGISLDTLAEDTDLSLAIHRTGYRVEYAPLAVGYTEAPETFRQLARQRFRWAFGTLQCVWKHRDITFNPRFKALGFFSLPGIWFFQVILVAFSPLIDLIFLQALFTGRGGDILPYFLVFLACDLAIAAVAVAIERLPLRMALRIIPQRFVYRPLLSYVVWRSLLQAMRGAWVGWNKLPRTASVSAA